MGKGKTVFTSNVVDEHGVVKQGVWIRAESVKTEHFLQTYVRDIGALARCSKAEISTVLCSLKYVVWETNEVVLNPSRRKEIAECGNLKLNTVNCSISRLVQKKLFCRIEGKLILNPQLFFFGTDIARLKTVDLVLKYNIKL